jgi:hypothetical protein
VRGWQQVDLDGLLGDDRSGRFHPNAQFASPRGIDAGKKGRI